MAVVIDWICGEAMFRIGKLSLDFAEAIRHGIADRDPVSVARVFHTRRDVYSGIS